VTTRATALEEARNSAELVEHRLSRVLDMLQHRTSKLEPQRVVDHLEGVREEVAALRAWLRAVGDGQ